MELVERDGFLASMQIIFDNVLNGDGHCILVSGEAGIGKSSLIKAFYTDKKNGCITYLGICDALFTPRPLAPLYDILLQMQSEIVDYNKSTTDRIRLFTGFLHELERQKETALVIIEDIHWADEATLDFIKFLARRIAQFRCLFILTCRDNEINTNHPLRNVLGQLPIDSFTRLQLTPLSKQAVENMARQKGYKGEDVYAVSGGNPFYVTELLASYNLGIPDSIKDSILSVYDRIEDNTRKVWDLLSVIPDRFELKYLEKLEPLYSTAIEYCILHQILLIKDGSISFRHELFRRTIENSLSPIKRMSLHKRILDQLKDSFEKKGELERIIHHAKNANENDVVVKYAPNAAKQAAFVGAHIEAARLYLSAIEYYHGNNADTLIHFYEFYAYECYLTKQIKNGIIYQARSLNLRKEKNDIEKTADCMRFLSRLWWYDGNRKNSEALANDAIELLKDQPSSRTKAMVLSNMSQLKMLAYEFDACIDWGEQAIKMAKEIADDEVLCHALNNVGTSLSRIGLSRQKGIALLQQSLQIAINLSYEDHAARAYTNLGSNAVKMKDYEFAGKILDEGIHYCEDRDLDTYTTYLTAFKARLCLEKGNWNESYHLAENLISNESQPSIVKIEALAVLATIKMRKGENDVIHLLRDAKEKAFETMEPQRIIPVVTAMLEYNWITGTSLIDKTDLDYATSLLSYKGNMYEKSEFCFWLMKTKKQHVSFPEFYEGYQLNNQSMARKAAGLWKELGCPYEQSLALFHGDETDKKEAITIAQKMGANASYEKMKFEMRASGIKSIPRGIRKSTQANTAHLTERELDVLQLLKVGLQNKEIADKLFISPKTVDHHISSIFFKLDVKSRSKAVQEAIKLEVLK